METYMYIIIGVVILVLIMAGILLYKMLGGRKTKEDIQKGVDHLNELINNAKDCPAVTSAEKYYDKLNKDFLALKAKFDANDVTVLATAIQGAKIRMLAKKESLCVKT